MRYRVAAALLFCVALSRVGAQNPTATLVGAVTDPSGSVVAGARLEIRNTATNQVRSVESDHKGEFTAPNLAAGFYEITVHKEGFRTLRQTDLELQLHQEARLELRLEVGAVSQTVEVTASLPQVNTENAAKGDVVVADEMVQMPLISRDFTDLAFLTPGVLPKAEGGESSSPMVINGARADNSNFVVDGFNARDPRDASPQVHPNLDSMQEFKLQTSGYSAETGRLAGGVMTMALKTGGNRFHGSLFEFLRNDVFDAKNFFAASRLPLRRNQFGAALDGPVLIPKLYNGRNRTFFLFSWESSRQRQRQPRLAVVPTEAERQGDFSASPRIKDPLLSGVCNATNAAACFPDNRIPASRLSPVALAAQAYFPLPNRPGQVNNYYADPPAPSDSDNFVVKIDQRVSQADNVSIRYLKNYGRSLIPFGGGNTGLFGHSGQSHGTLAGINYTRMFTPTVINEVRFSVSRTFGRWAGVHSGTDYNKMFGMSGGTTDPSLIGFPLFMITNYANFGDAVGWPSAYVSTNYNVSDTMTRVKGSHLLKAGVDILRSQMFQPASGNTRGTYYFTGATTNQPYADFALGLPNSATRQVIWARNYLFTTNYSFFAQDDWKVTSRLTLNLGLRYELPMPPFDKYGRWTNFIPEINKLVISSDKGIAPGVSFTNASQVETAQQAKLPSSLIYPDYKDFAPRIGFAWRPFGGNRTVLRGGYGIFYGAPGMWVNVRSALGSVFPFSISQTVNRNANNPYYLTLANPFPVSPNLASNVVNVTGFQLHAPTPYLQSWNLTAERALGRESAVEVGYTGSKGTHLGRAYNINQPFRSAEAYPNFPFPYPQWNTISYYGFYLNSIYNSANVTLRRRFVRNFFYRVNYTFSKSIDYGSQLQGNSSGGYSGVQDARNLRGERGRSDFDIGHTFTMSFSWVAPLGRHVLLRGWQLAGTGIARTGAPFTPQVNNVNLNLGEASRPDRIAKGTVPEPTPGRWYDVAAFPRVPTGSYTYGNSGRGILDGAGAMQINLSLNKNLKVAEKGNLQFRWEAFSVLNHPNFNLPVIFVNQPNAATVTSAGGARQMQVGMRYSF